MENYKKKSLNFSKTLDNRELRAYRRSVDRQNIKHKRLSALRGIDDNHIEESTIEENVKKVQVNIPKKPERKNVQITNPRAEMLKKWREEKELKRKLESRKQPAFVVSRVNYKPPPVLTFPPKDNIAQKDESKHSCSSLGTSRLAFPKTSNVQNTSRLLKCQSSGIGIPKTSANKASVTQVNVKLLHNKAVAPSKIGAGIAKLDVKPRSGQNNIINPNIKKNVNSSVSKTIPSQNKTSNALKTAFKPSFNKTLVPSSKSNNNVSSATRINTLKFQASKNCPAPKSPSGVTRVPRMAQNTKPKPGSTSFAPTNFLFKAPVNVEKFIFPNGIPSSKEMTVAAARNNVSKGSLKDGKICVNDFVASQACEKQKVITSTNKCDKKLPGDLHIKESSAVEVDEVSQSTISSNNKDFSVQQEKCDEMQSNEKSKPIENMEKNFAAKVCEVDNLQNELPNKVPSFDEKNPFIIPVIFPASIVKASSSNNAQNDQTDIESGCGGLIKAEVASEVLLDKHKEKPDSTLGEIPVQTENPITTCNGKENRPPEPEVSSETTKGGSAVSVIDKGIPYSLRSGALHTIAEDLEICENTPLADKIKYASQSVITPRRSRRLASLYAKMNPISKDGSSIEQNSLHSYGTEEVSLTLHSDLAEELSSLSVTTKNDQVCSRKTNETEPEVPATANPCDSQPDKPRRGRLSIMNVKRLTNLSSCMEIKVGDSLNADIFSSPNRPMTRQQRKISLLGSPQIPSNLPRKSVRGDLITFSPA